MSTPIPQPIFENLQRIEPNSSFTAKLPVVHSSSGAQYYVKLGSSSDLLQYEGEVESLKCMGDAAPSLVPKVLSFSVSSTGQPCFISEYKDIGSLSSSAAILLAKRLATELHTIGVSKSGFGFPIPTYCGATKISHQWFERWDQCFHSMINDLLTQIWANGRHQDLCAKGDAVCQRVIPKLLGTLNIKPVILHGDLWSGNVGVDRITGQPTIFDPASYYGHNEADLSIAKMFGGFPQSFFTTYHQYIPKTEPVEEYNLRMDLYELFHYLNHTLLFGETLFILLLRPVY